MLHIHIHIYVEYMQNKLQAVFRNDGLA